MNRDFFLPAVCTAPEKILADKKIYFGFVMRHWFLPYGPYHRYRNFQHISYVRTHNIRYALWQHYLFNRFNFFLLIWSLHSSHLSMRLNWTTSSTMSSMIIFQVKTRAAGNLILSYILTYLMFWFEIYGHKSMSINSVKNLCY